MMQAQGKSKFAERLKKIQGGMSTAKRQQEKMGESGVFPEGEYVGKTMAKVRESRSSGNLMVSRTFIATEGELQGLPAYDNLIIDQPNTQSALRAQRDLVKYIDTCGYSFDPESNPEQLEDVLEELSKDAPIVRYRVRHSSPDDDSGTVFVNVDVLGTPEVNVPSTPRPAGKKAGAKRKGGERKR